MEKVKEVLSSKVIEATTFIKGMSIHESEVAFLDIDERGRILAQHLLNAGVKIRLWEPTVRSPAQRQLGGENVVVVKSISDVVTKQTHVILITLQKDEMDSVFEDETIISSFRHKTVVMCTPLSTAESQQQHDTFSNLGVHYVEAAFCGSNAIAEKAQLKVLVGGSQEHYDKLKPILSLFGMIFYAGVVPKATALKQAIDLVLVAENAALAMATTHLHKQGLNSEVFLDVLGHVRHSNLAEKLLSFELRKYDSAKEMSNDDVLAGLKFILQESRHSGVDTDLVDCLIKYTELALENSNGQADIESVYDALNPPKTSTL